MRVLLDDDVHAFANRVLPWAAREPVVNNLLATTAESVRDGRRRNDDALWLTVLGDDDTVVGAAMQIWPYRLFLASMADPALRTLAETLRDVRPKLTGVIGDTDTAASFVRQWQRVCGATATAGRDQRLHVLGVLTRPEDVAGGCRPATAADRSVLLDWSLAFSHEAVPDRPTDDLPDAVDRRITEAAYYLWEVDGRAVSFAGAWLPSAGVSRVGPVYTPPEERRRGYASACVAAISRRVMDAGAARCMLYTDLANPTSNAIYRRIGYRPVCDAREYDFGYPRDR